ncbi:TPA_asm: RNA-directed RNA polymerase [ssRNA phage Esthiorhiza.4_8]|uniref:RNA-directed RNA polymerase n=2 Tax=Leviviricetes TaxID=2842243 RepID=A0A8S5L1X6_9VIRU|nr:RNA-directed RNA polymerase [ssRNA phage Esthiorhiza.4_8]QDH87335.1 MAG: RNA-dependent RNA polymerase [Leviviridae sp.]DAD51483.1 TPA_asm: RNA-directed RNA polymerase [ssRNA phage Esthiorhiza.4_8]
MTTIPMGHEFLLGAYKALYRDIVRWIPEVNRKSIEWDQTHLERLVLDRGQRYFTIDLPEFGKVFEQSLASGSLRSQSIPGFHKLVTCRGNDARPRLFWALTSRVFKYDGTLRDQPCSTSIFLIRQLCYLFKKLKGECSEHFKFAAIADLYAVEESLPCPSLDWEDPIGALDWRTTISFADGSACASTLAGIDGTSGSSTKCGTSFGLHLQRVFDIVGCEFPFLETHQIRGRHGPGAVSDGSRNGSKYSFPVWPAKLQSLFPFDRHASTNYMLDDTYPIDGQVASKLAVVPKTHKGPRIIASEPTANQWIQQGLEDFLLDGYKKSYIGTSINISDQTQNQQMARIASFGGSATIDLSAASDRLTCYVVERAFRKRPDILSAMMACRTPLLSNAIDKKHPKLLKLKKFAMMGSALTFPVQSFVFYCISVAAVLWTRGLQVTVDNIRQVGVEVTVYGDDIIVPVDSCKVLVESLTSLALKVNSGKSFWTGKFRESCGTDWYDGVDVTPSYIRSDFDPAHPSSLSSVVEASNNFYKKGLWAVSDYLTCRIPYRLRLKLAIEDGSVAIKGLFSFVGTCLDHLKKRYNKELGRWEYKVLNLSGELDTPKPDGFDRLRQYFTETPDPTVKWDPRVRGRMVHTLKERFAPLYEGAKLSLIGGEVRVVC